MSDKSQIVKGTLIDIGDWSSGTEYWVRLDKGEDEKLFRVGQKVEIHGKG